MSQREKVYSITITWPHSNAKPMRLTFKDPLRALEAIGLHAKNSVVEQDPFHQTNRDMIIELTVLEVIE